MDRKEGEDKIAPVSSNLLLPLLYHHHRGPILFEESSSLLRREENSDSDVEGVVVYFRFESEGEINGERGGGL